MASIPSTCRAAVLEKANAGLAIKQVPVRQPKEGEVLVKVKASSVCHTDVIVGSGAFGDLFPKIPGHEIVGSVVALGPGVTKWKIGQVVGGGWHGGHCTQCRQCMKGMFQLCDTEAVNGVSFDGGYAEYVVLRSEAIVQLPENVDPFATAPLMCAGVTVFNSIRSQKVTAGEVVAIQGIGGLGHLAIQFASKMGFRTVALSSSGSKRDFAHQLGAHDYIDGSKEDTVQALQKMGGAAMIVGTAPNSQLIHDLMPGLAPQGKFLLLTPIGDVSVPSPAMIVKSTSLVGWSSGHQIDSQETVDFANRHGVSCMIEKFPLDKVNEAFERVHEGHVRFRAVLVME